MYMANVVMDDAAIVAWDSIGGSGADALPEVSGSLEMPVIVTEASDDGGWVATAGTVLIGSIGLTDTICSA